MLNRFRTSACTAHWTDTHPVTGKYPNISYKVNTLHCAAQEEKLRAYWNEQTCKVTQFPAVIPNK